MGILVNKTFQHFGNHVTCNAVHPGIVSTNMYQHNTIVCAVLALDSWN